MPISSSFLCLLSLLQLSCSAAAGTHVISSCLRSSNCKHDQAFEEDMFALDVTESPGPAAHSSSDFCMRLCLVVPLSLTWRSKDIYYPEEPCLLLWKPSSRTSQRSESRWARTACCSFVCLECCFLFAGPGGYGPPSDDKTSVVKKAPAYSMGARVKDLRSGFFPHRAILSF